MAWAFLKIIKKLLIAQEIDKMGYEELVKKNNTIHPTAVINWEKVQMGNGNVVGPFVCIGTDAQHITQKSNGNIHIGNNNTFREFTTVHLPTKISKVTSIGDENYFMCYSHIAHDCKVESQVIVAVGGILNGHVTVMKGAYIGTGVVIHQFQTIGSYSILGMNSTVTKKSQIIPGGKYIGSPAKRVGINQVALDKNSISKEALDNELIRYHHMLGIVRQT